VNSETFHLLIVDDALRVKSRQEMDSIAIIDDVRYHIDLLLHNLHEARKKHEIIDRLLNKLEFRSIAVFLLMLIKL
jgi:hypothetical protein